jgi:hypothetical protein
MVDPTLAAQYRQPLMTTSERAAWWVGGLALASFVAWSFVLALGLPLDSWDAYDYLVNARHLAGHDMVRLSQNYRVDRPPGISLLVAPLLAWNYQPGQRGAAGLIHLVPWALGLWAVLVVWRELRTSVGVVLAFLGAVLLAFNPLVLHYLPFVMADVPSMTFSLLSLVFAERVLTTQRGLDSVLLAVFVAAAMLSKYPVAALGVAIPLANAAWSLAGRGRPSSVRGVLVSLVQPRLAVPLLVGLGLFLAVEAWVFSRFVPGVIGWWPKLSAGLTSAWGSAGGGSGGGETDPRWEIPYALVALFGVPVVGLSLLGVVRTVATRDRRALFHAAFLGVMLALFVAVIGHKESRYAFPVLPSLVWLAMYGLAWLRWHLLALAVAVVSLAFVVPPALAELKRMNDPLYQKPSILAWARFALEHAGATRPILQLPVLPQFALYPKSPVVLPMDEFWHYHHFNEGGLTWFFDRRLQALQVQAGAEPTVRHESPWFFVTVPQTWLDAVGDDAVWLGAFPDGAVLVSTAQGWFETRTAAAQPEPPAPFVATNVKHVTLTRREESRFSGGSLEATATRGEQGWSAPSSPLGFAWFFRDAQGVPHRWTQPLAELPGQLEGLSRETVMFPVR